MAKLDVFQGSTQGKLSELPLSEQIACLKQVVPRSVVASVLKERNPDRRTCSKCPALMMA